MLTAGETAMHKLGDQIPDGTIIGARGPFGVFAPDTELQQWFREAYDGPLQGAAELRLRTRWRRRSSA